MDHDLTPVDPDRRAETARRIAAVERFLAAPGRKAAAAGAAELGVGIVQFYRIARSWRESRSPDKVTGSSAGRVRGAKGRPLLEGHLALIRGAEAGMPEATVTRVAQEARRLASSLGLTMPSPPTLRAAVAAARRARLADEPAGTGLAVMHCCLGVAVLHEGASVAPVATMVVDLEARRVIGVALNAEGCDPASAASALADALGGTTDSGEEGTQKPVPVLLYADRDPVWSELVETLAGHGLARHGRDLARMPTGQAAVALLGKKVGGLRLLARASRKPPASRPGVGEALAIDEAERFVRTRIVTGHVHRNPLSRIPEAVRVSLMEALRDLSRRKPRNS